jgi:hypothetical protein
MFVLSQRILRRHIYFSGVCFLKNINQALDFLPKNFVMSCGCSCRCGACQKDACACPCHGLDELSNNRIIRLLFKHGVKRNTNEMSAMSRSKLFTLMRESKNANRMLKAGVRKVQKIVRKRNASVSFASFFDNPRIVYTPEPKTAKSRSVAKDCSDDE